MADYYLVTPLGPFPAAIGNAFNTFTTRQDISPRPLPIMQGGTARAGMKLKLEAEGEFSNTGTPTLVLGFYIGTEVPAITTPLAESSAITTASGVTALPWRLEYRGIFTATGTTGTIVGCGSLEYGTTLTAVTTVPIPITLALRTVTIDTTIARAFGVCATWGTSSASNTIKTYNISALVLN